MKSSTRGTGAAVCVANLMLKITAVDTTARSVVHDWAKDVKTTSQNQYCPVDKGDLKKSAKEEVTKNTITEFFVRISYGEGLDYAIYVHEIPNMHNHGQWKFLSTPFHVMSSKLLSETRSKCGALL